MRHRLKLASWTVVRERGQPSPWILVDPAAVALLAGDLLRDATLCANDSETLPPPEISVEGGERCLSHGEPGRRRVPAGGRARPTRRSSLMFQVAAP